jgi:hypothetical protein
VPTSRFINDANIFCNNLHTLKGTFTFIFHELLHLEFKELFLDGPVYPSTVTLNYLYMN